MIPESDKRGDAQQHVKLDILSTPDGVEHIVPCDLGRSSASVANRGRPWIGVLFECCGVYARVYREPSAERYDGRCPRCGVPVMVRVSPDGVETSFVRAQVQ